MAIKPDEWRRPKSRPTGFFDNLNIARVAVRWQWFHKESFEQPFDHQPTMEQTVERAPQAALSDGGEAKEQAERESPCTEPHVIMGN